jgi:hypothetical protein
MISKINKTREKEKIRLIKSFRLVIIGRWFWYFTVAMVGLVSKITGTPNQNFSGKVMTVMFVLVFFINLSSWLYAKYFEKFLSVSRIKKIIFTTSLLEVVLVTLIVFYAGGIMSKSFIYYILPIIVMGIAYSGVGIYLIACLANLSWGVLIYLQYNDIIPYLGRYNDEFEYQLAHNFSAVITDYFLVAGSNYVVAIIAAILAKSLLFREKENTNRMGKG